MVFLPGSELTTNVWPLGSQPEGSFAAAAPCLSSDSLWVFEQDAGRSDTFRVDRPRVPNPEGIWLIGCGTPLVCSEKRGRRLL